MAKSRIPMATNGPLQHTNRTSRRSRLPQTPRLSSRTQERSQSLRWPAADGGQLITNPPQEQHHEGKHGKARYDENDVDLRIHTIRIVSETGGNTIMF